MKINDIFGKDLTVVNVGLASMAQSISDQGVKVIDLDGTFGALTQSWLKISINPATDDGGGCRGDSGGPYFLDDSNMIVSVVSGGDGACRAMAWTYRLDTESARSFLKDFVTLP